MGSVNVVHLVGNVGKDPDIRATQDGKAIANLSLATSDVWRDRSTGERRERTEWHRVVCFNEHITKVIQAHVKKGSRIYVSGALQTRKWTDQSGVEKYSTEVVLQNFRGELTLLDGKPDSDDRSERPAYDIGSDRDPQTPPQRSISERASPGARPLTEVLDDDLPPF